MMGNGLSKHNLWDKWKAVYFLAFSIFFCSASTCFFLFSSLATVLRPICPPPHLRTTLLLNWLRKFSWRVSSLVLSSLLTEVKATTAQFFLWTRVPRRLLPLMMAYGTFILRQRAGSQRTNSTGSTSWAMRTRLAFFCSIRVVMCFKPNLRTFGGAVVGTASPAALALASSARRWFLTAFVSGWYLTRSLKTSAAWFLSSVFWNWAMTGGTFKRWRRIYKLL